MARRVAGERAACAGGGDALEERELLEDATGAFGHGGQRIIGNVNRQAGFLRDEPVNVPQQRPAAGHNDPSVNQVRGQFRWAAFQRDADRFQDARQGFLQRFANLF